jgi:2-aminoadipate transaminase
MDSINVETEIMNMATPLLKEKTGKTTMPRFRLAKRMSKMSVSAVREILKMTEHPEIISFAGGMPAPELFPIAEMARAYADVFALEGPAAAQYGTTEGWLPLRTWIAGRMKKRGVETEASQVIITTGSQQGIDLACKVFLEPGDQVIVENPCYLAALQAFSGAEVSVIPIESDDNGMRVETLEAVLARSRPKLIYVVSDFSNPKGTTLPAARRKLLAELAARYRVPVLEDNPYGELRYRGEPVPPIAAFDEAGYVIYLSTFSKTLSPGMRLGWVSASDEILKSFVIAKQASDLHTSTIEQRAAARLLASFDFDANVKKLCKFYGERCQRMQDSIDSYFPSEVRATRPEGGLFLWVEMPEYISGEEVFAEAIKEKVAVVPGSPFFTDGRKNFLRLNFSNQSPDNIEEGIKRVGDVIKGKIK